MSLTTTRTRRFHPHPYVWVLSREIYGAHIARPVLPKHTIHLRSTGFVLGGTSINNINKPHLQSMCTDIDRSSYKIYDNGCFRTLTPTMLVIHSYQCTSGNRSPLCISCPALIGTRPSTATISILNNTWQYLETHNAQQLNHLVLQGLIQDQYYQGLAGDTHEPGIH